jgi:hypothetical protein
MEIIDVLGLSELYQKIPILVYKIYILIHYKMMYRFLYYFNYNNIFFLLLLFNLYLQVVINFNYKMLLYRM